MLFNHLIGIKSEPTSKVTSRTAIRGVIMDNNRLLMVSNNKGDIKFPGGGVDPEEIHSDTVKREVKEETGYELASVGQELGRIIERRRDLFEENTVFEMTSHYYLCALTGEVHTQALDDYEKEMGFVATWVTIDEAIEINQSVFEQESRNPWVERELYVLHRLKEHFMREATSSEGCFQQS